MAGQVLSSGQADENLSLLFKKIILKPIVRGLMRIMPAKTFDRFYAWSFPIYKFFVRQAYVAMSILRLDFLSGHKWTRTRRVYAVAPFSLVGMGGLEVTFEETSRVNDERVPGDYVELGVARGGAASLLAFGAFDPKSPVKRHLWLFDSYEGLPDPGELDYAEDHTTGDHVRPLPKGSCLGTLDEVKSLLFGHFHFPEQSISFIKGWFQDTVPVQEPKLGRIAILRIDGDWYESTKICLNYLYDHVSPGGSVIVDDYLSCIGCKRAVDEFMQERDIRSPLVGDGRGGCYFRKPA